MAAKKNKIDTDEFEATIDEELEADEVEADDMTDQQDYSDYDYHNENDTDYDSVREGTSDGIRLISAYHFFWSALMVLLMCGASVPTVITGIVGIAEDPEVFIATAILSLVVFVLLLLSIIYGVVGYGLWNRRQWARTAAIALSILSLPAIPIGTLGGGVTLWYLMQDRVARQFH